MQVGGTDYSYLRLRSLFAPADLKERIMLYETTGFFAAPYVTQQEKKDFYYFYGMTGFFITSSVDSLLDVTSMCSTIPVITAISLGNVLKISLTITVYTPLPGAAISLADYCNKYLATLALTYKISGIGTIDAGWVAGIGYTVKNEQVNDFGTWYTSLYYHDNNVFFIDAKLSLESLQDLTILTGAELIQSTFYNEDPVSGTGTANDPYVRAILNSFKINYGFEISYNMEKLIKGLSLGLGVYTNYGTGKTFQNMNPGTETFSEFNTRTYPEADWVLLNSYTEENYIQYSFYDYSFPFSCYAKIDYSLASWNFSIQNLFIKLHGMINGASNWWNVIAPGAKRPMGFYDTDQLTFATTLTHGSVSFTASLSYMFFIGLPGINELGYTDAIAQALGYHNVTGLYNDKAPDKVKYPWNLSFAYQLQY